MRRDSSGLVSGRLSRGTSPHRIRKTARGTAASKSFTSGDGDTAMFSFLKKRWFVIGAGLLLLSLFIWFAGPYFAFADFHPLESATARLVLILLVLIATVAVVVVKRFKA